MKEKGKGITFRTRKGGRTVNEAPEGTEPKRTRTKSASRVPTGQESNEPSDPRVTEDAPMNGGCHADA